MTTDRPELSRDRAAPGPAAYSLAFVSYVALGLWTNGLVLNWVVGPLYLVVVLYAVPQAYRAFTRRDLRGRDHG
jgi:hypothetical protein